MLSIVAASASAQVDISCTAAQYMYRDSSCCKRQSNALHYKPFFIPGVETLHLVSGENDVVGDLIARDEKRALVGIQGCTASVTANCSGIADIGTGLLDLVRGLFTLNEVTSDSTSIVWGDPGLHELALLDFDVYNPVTIAMFERLRANVHMTSAFLEHVDVAHDSARTRAVRFAKALTLSYAVDWFGAFVVDDTGAPVAREQVFAHVEAELLGMIAAPVDLSLGSDYMHIGPGAERALLGRLYLNAQTYTGAPRVDDAIATLEPIAANATLHPSYPELFMADNDDLVDEILVSVKNGGDSSDSGRWGSTTFLVHAGFGAGVQAADYGVDGGWAGYAAFPDLIQKFEASSEFNGVPYAWADESVYRVFERIWDLGPSLQLRVPATFSSRMGSEMHIFYAWLLSVVFLNASCC